MNVALFFSLICWAGLVASSVVLLLILFGLYYENFTTAGRLGVLSDAMRGIRRSYAPNFIRAGIVFVISLAGVLSVA